MSYRGEYHGIFYKHYKTLYMSLKDHVVTATE